MEKQSSNPVTSSSNVSGQDNDYKSALQPIVDEAMLPHNLAPAIATAITENKPLNDELQNVIKESIERNPDVKQALDKAISDSNAIKKSKLDYRQPGFWIPILISAIVGVAGVAVAVLALNK